MTQIAWYRSLNAKLGGSALAMLVLALAGKPAQRLGERGR